MTLEELTLAFTLFPNLGARPDRLRFLSADGDPVMVPVAAAEPTLEILAVLSASLRRNPYADVLSGTNLPLERLWGRGGTSYGFRDAWFVGGDARYTCGVWVGMEDGSPLGPAAFSSEFALPLWAAVLELAGAGTEPLPISPQVSARIAALLEPAGEDAIRPPSRAVVVHAKPVRPRAAAVVGPDPYRVQKQLTSKLVD